MKNLRNVVSFCAAGLIAGLVVSIAALTPRLVHAQNPTLTPWQFGVNGATHTSCQVVASSTQFCFASDGVWQSINGGAFTQLGTPAAGVTSFNGRTGAVTLTKPDVLSTGISATVTITAPTTSVSPPVVTVAAPTATTTAPTGTVTLQ